MAGTAPRWPGHDGEATRHIVQMLIDIRIYLARKPSVAAMWGMIATTVGIAAALIGLFVGILTYLQAFHDNRPG